MKSERNTHPHKRKRKKRKRKADRFKVKGKVGIVQVGKAHGQEVVREDGHLVAFPHGFGKSQDLSRQRERKREQRMGGKRNKERGSRVEKKSKVQAQEEKGRGKEREGVGKREREEKREQEVGALRTMSTSSELESWFMCCSISSKIMLRIIMGDFCCTSMARHTKRWKWMV